ncbi:MAG: hypothetical protein ACXVZV_16065 [Terriglobales bacterium]
MSCSLEYHISVRHSIPASLALLGLLALPLTLVSTSQAQINGTPASVTSPGFGGRAINGTPPSVTSLGPRGLVPNSRVTFNTFNGSHVGDGHRHHHRTEFTPPPVVYAVPVPYAVDLNAPYDVEDSSADEPDANYQGGPTIFDRRGSGAASYIPPVMNSPRTRPAAEEADADVASPDPDPPQEPTLLVFKDGRKLELGNYAIIGATLFDLTPGHARRVALADLDLEATRKQNDERGVTFQLPPRSQAN